MNATRPLAALALAFAAMIASPATAQTISGADRYMGSVQSSLGRTNGMSATMTPNYVTHPMGGSPMIGATQQSFDRTTAAMQSILANRAATTRGYGEATIYRTQDNLIGVYLQMEVANLARMASNIRSSGFGMSPYGESVVASEFARLNRIQQAWGQQVRRRFHRRGTPLPSNPGVFTDDVPPNGPGEVSSALQPAAAPPQPAVTIIAPTPIPTLARGRLPRD